jgi:hypothetical protein
MGRSGRAALPVGSTIWVLTARSRGSFGFRGSPPQSCGDRISLSLLCIFAALEYAVSISMHKTQQWAHMLCQLAAEGRQVVLDLRRLRGMHLPANEAVSLEPSQCLRQHFLTDATDEIGKFTKAIAARRPSIQTSAFSAVVLGALPLPVRRVSVSACGTGAGHWPSALQRRGSFVCLVAAWTSSCRGRAEAGHCR